ncbi:MAG: hypothetical protein HYZ44_11465 [Bacteroidetes bacterium]|nr:hypothetical protein [Bacteroidota bacterium]
MNRLIIFLLLLSPLLVSGQDNLEQHTLFVLESSLPSDLLNLYTLEKIKGNYALRTDINPFYLRGDFDGDKVLDYALGIVDRATGKKGILIYHFGAKSYYVVGAGKLISNSRNMDDLSLMDAWTIHTVEEVEKGVGETSTIKLKGEAILGIKTESSSWLIYWTGKEYSLYWQGD